MAAYGLHLGYYRTIYKGDQVMRIFGIEITGARIVGLAILTMTVYGGLQVLSLAVDLAAKING